MEAKHLGLRIRQARDRLGISQEDLAAAIGKDQGAISEYENGRRKLAATELPALATALEVPLDYFFAEEDRVYELDDALLNYFHRLPNIEARRAALDIVRIFSTMLHSMQ